MSFRAGPLAIGRISGVRGPAGEVTVRVVSGEARRWRKLARVLITAPSGEGGRFYDVERATPYRDRLVLKLGGVDDAGAGRVLRGGRVLAPPDQVPGLPPGTHYVARLVGLEVQEQGARLGEVMDVVTTPGCDVLVVRQADGHELLIPLSEEIVIAIREDEGRIAVRLPEGLRELNRGASSGPRREPAAGTRGEDRR